MSLCASVYMCFVVTCWERADLLVLVCGVLSIGILGLVWYLIVSIPDLCTLTYFTYTFVKIVEKLPIRDNTWNSKVFTWHNSLHDSNEYCVSAVCRLLLKKKSLSPDQDQEDGYL